MRVVGVHPGEVARVEEIESGLDAMQKYVGGLIQMVMPFQDDVAVICNDEAKLEGMALNRALRDNEGNIYDILAGDFFICYAPCDSEDFQSMPDDLLEKYLERFLRPEEFYLVDGKIIAI